MQLQAELALQDLNANLKSNTVSVKQEALDIVVPPGPCDPIVIEDMSDDDKEVHSSHLSNPGVAVTVKQEISEIRVPPGPADIIEIGDSDDEAVSPWKCLILSV